MNPIELTKNINVVACHGRQRPSFVTRINNIVGRTTEMTGADFCVEYATLRSIRKSVVSYTESIHLLVTNGRGNDFLFFFLVKLTLPMYFSSVKKFTPGNVCS